MICPQNVLRISEHLPALLCSLWPQGGNIIHLRLARGANMMLLQS